MAAIESKRSKQEKAISNQQLAISQGKTHTKTAGFTRKERLPSLPALPPPRITKHGKTTIRRYRGGRSFYRFEEIKGKPVEFVEVFTACDYHCIDIRFEDKTALHFIIDPGFTLDTEYSNWKTGNLRRIKRWPLIRSAGLNL